MREEGWVKGVHVVVVNAGWGNSLMEFYGSVESVANRSHQVISDRLKCQTPHMSSLKKETGERSQKQINEVAIWKIINQGRTYACPRTKRDIAERRVSNCNAIYQQCDAKTHSQGMRKLRIGRFPQRRAEQIVQAKAGISGINPDEIKGLGGKRRRTEE